MQDGTLPHDEHEPRAGIRGALTAAALRAVDAGLRTLQGWRNRIEPSVEEEDSRHGRSRRGAVDEPAAVAVAVPQPRSLLRRALTVLLCLALGAGAGTFSAHRGFAQLLASRQAVIEFQQEEIDLAKKEEALNLNAKAKAQNEIADYRKRLREAQQEIEDQAGRIEELDQQVVAMKQRAERAAAPPPLAVAARGRPAPRKTGNCVTGTTNAGGSLLDCIDKFNRP